jgi:hypothetical protein
MTNFTDRLAELGFEIESGDPDETQLLVVGKQGAEWASDALGVSEAAAPTEQVQYYAERDPDGSVLLVFREYLDRVEKRHGFQRWADGEWIDDPSLIAEKREPGVSAVSPDEAQRLLRNR